MTMPKGIVIPALSDEPMRLEEFKKLSDYQDAVDGLIQVIDLTTPEGTLYVNEEGIVKTLPYNSRASMFAAVHNRAYLWNDPIILGNAIVLGPPDDEGRTQDVPGELVEILLNTPLYKILVQTVDDKEAWNGNQRRYDEMHDAYEAAVRLAHVWGAVERVKVVSA